VLERYISSPPFPFFPLHSLSLPSLSSLPLEVGSLSGVWGGAPAEIEFGAFKP